MKTTILKNLRVPRVLMLLFFIIFTATFISVATCSWFFLQFLLDPPPSEEFLTLQNYGISSLTRVGFLSFLSVSSLAWLAYRFKKALEIAIKERRLAQKEQADLRFALSESSIVAFTDTQGNITSVNKKFCETSQYSEEELLGANHRILNSGTHSKEFFKKLWDTISSGEVWSGEIKNRAKDGSYYWVFTTIIPFNDNSGKPYQYVSIRTDITEKKLAEEHIEQERAKLVHSEKMASLGEMAAGIAHELGNPLASIQGRVDLLEIQMQQGPVTNEQIQKAITVIQTLSLRMNRIIHGMSAYARDASQDPFQKTSPTRIFKEVLEFSSERFEKLGIKVHFDESAKDLEILCRETQLSQVFVNLLNNARDAISSLEEKWIRILIQEEGEFVQISITDSGHGIPVEIRQKILQPFFSTKDVGKGTGLGLSISKAIVESHHGILFLDEDCENTRFVIKIPQFQHASHHS